ncbi:histone H2B type 1-M-like [Rhinatrema bivittatum]|uniref:histone H2B type 1-M-like n=1 Tax=Rhinatrema bivittatum TaxID=194408 RepID=UPI00112ED84B|nr:histone H2B type 1-M-like [Rhinatrema bivittatum]XP_029470809.1 histone H2B type 1-M-like [Rhinatrema bivittatum]
MPEATRSAPASKQGSESEGGGSRKKRKRSRQEGFADHVQKVLQQVHPDTDISSGAMNIMDAFVSDVFERIAAEASRLAQYNKRSSITSRDIQTAARLLLPGAGWQRTPGSQ